MIDLAGRGMRMVSSSTRESPVCRTALRNELVPFQQRVDKDLASILRVGRSGFFEKALVDVGKSYSFRRARRWSSMTAKNVMYCNILIVNILRTLFGFRSSVFLLWHALCFYHEWLNNGNLPGNETL